MTILIIRGDGRPVCVDDHHPVSVQFRPYVGGGLWWALALLLLGRDEP